MRTPPDYGALYAVDAPHFYAGVIVNGPTIIFAAPILRWAVGRRWSWFQGYARRKGWKIVSTEP